MVRSGETLGTIAQRFSVTTQQIQQYNDLDNTLIRVNQPLHIPYPQAKHYNPKFRNQLVIHYVKPGDSINSLSHYYRVSKKDIMRLNHLHKNQLLKLGQAIKIYFSS